MILADKIINERKKNGWSQEELAEKLNVSRQAVSKWESAGSAPDLQRILQMADVFGVSTDYLLKDDLEESQYVEGASDTEEAVRRVSMEEANAFMEIERESAAKIARGVFLCIISPICLILLGVISEEQKLAISENAAGGIGIVVLLGLIAAAVMIFISCGLKGTPYEYLGKEKIETHYGVEGLVRERKKQFSGTYARNLIIGITLCILGTMPLFISLIFTEDDFVMVLMVCLLFLIEAIGVYTIVKVCIIQSSFDKLLQEGDYTKSKKEGSKISEAVGTIYWLIAVAIYLAYSFITNDWDISWIVWPIAGVLFPAVVAIAKALGKK